MVEQRLVDRVVFERLLDRHRCRQHGKIADLQADSVFEGVEPGHDVFAVRDLQEVVGVAKTDSHGMFEKDESGVLG